METLPPIHIRCSPLSFYTFVAINPLFHPIHLLAPNSNSTMKYLSASSISSLLLFSMEYVPKYPLIPISTQYNFVDQNLMSD